MQMFKRAGELLFEELASLCMNKLHSDVEFVVGDQHLPGHRAILAARSEYFRALLCGHMAESEAREVRLDVQLEPFKIILEYLYSSKLNLKGLDVNKVIEVLVLAHLYGLECAVKIISQNLWEQRNVRSVCLMLDAARRYNLDALTNDCFKFIDINAVEVLKHDSIEMLSKDTFEELLRRDLGVPPVDIFQSVCKWKKSNPTEDISTLVSFIQFPRMSIDDLLHVVRPSGLLEVDKIFDAIDQANTARNQNYRISVNIGNAVEYPAYITRIISENQFDRVIQLCSDFRINYIIVSLLDNDSQDECKFNVEVSSDQTTWEALGIVTIPKAISKGSIRFTERRVRYIRVQNLDGLKANARSSQS